jgi:F-type H+-transporting ATPase subunit alpha
MLELKHKEDVLDVLKSGVINDEVSAILEKVAEQIVQSL